MLLPKLENPCTVLHEMENFMVNAGKISLIKSYIFDISPIV
jgi:hypothetical protein